jgi:gluconolactonase
VYAQTNLQLFNQLRDEGCPTKDLRLVADAYEMAMHLFSGRFQPSGKSFIAHVVGTASILASLRSPASVVAAGLLHNVYEHGDFGTGVGGRSYRKANKISRLVSAEVESYVAKFAAFHWQSHPARIALATPDRLEPLERNVLLIRLADYLEHLLDLDLLYYSPAGRRYFCDNAGAAIRVAQSLRLEAFAAELEDAIHRLELAELPVELPPEQSRSGSFVIPPASCRRRLPAIFATLATRTAGRIGRERHRIRRSLAQKRAQISGRMRERRLLKQPVSSIAPELSVFFPTGARMERIAGGFQFTEGPLWMPDQSALLFSDIPANKIYQATPAGHVTVFRYPSGNSNGLARDHQGRLIACEHSNRRVTRTEQDGTITVLADRFNDRRLNSPNDVVAKSDGAIYFTDPPYGIHPEQQEQPCAGVYRLSPDGGTLSLVVRDMEGPNGLAFSPDESKLYIDDSKRRHIRVFDVASDGAVYGGAVFCDMNVVPPGSPDGMKVDVEGNLYCTGPGGVWVIDPGGKHLGTILTPQKPSNCAWGSDDLRDLYITAGTAVYRVRVNIPGIRVC